MIAETVRELERILSIVCDHYCIFAATSASEMMLEGYCGKCRWPHDIRRIIERLEDDIKKAAPVEEHRDGQAAYMQR